MGIEECQEVTGQKVVASLSGSIDTMVVASGKSGEDIWGFLSSKEE
jgi:hypothetical protein